MPQERAGRRVNVARTILIGVVGSTIPLIGNLVAVFVADRSPVVSWFAVPVTAVVFGVMATLATAHLEDREPQGHPPERMPVRRRRGTTLPVGLLVAVLVLAGGGLAVAAGARYVVGRITGVEEGTDRLVQSKSVTTRRVTLTVAQVVHTLHFTRVTASVSNGLPNPISLSLFQNCTLRGGDGTTVQADAFRSDWSDRVAPGAHGQRGTIVFPGHVPDTVASAALSFATVWEAGFDGPRSLTVSGLALRPP